MDTSLHSLAQYATHDDESDSYDVSTCLAEAEKKASEDREELKILSKADRRMIIKNVVVICIVFFLNFTGYWALAALQSSLHAQAGMGVINQAIVYGSLALSCLLLPKIAIKVMGHKWVMTGSIIGYMLWIAANGYACWGTMVPASLFIGITGSTLWTAQGSYFNIAAHQYSLLCGKSDSRVVKSMFFGIFFCVLRFSGSVSSVVSSVILAQKSTTGSDDPGNWTMDDDVDVYRFCGVNDCPREAVQAVNRTIVPPEAASKSLVWILVGVCLALSGISLVISAIFVDEIPDDWLDVKCKTMSNRQMVASSLFATIKHMKHTKQLLLIPLTIYVGLQQTFLDADYSKAFVTCYLGIWMVGLTNIPRFILNAIAAYTGGRIVKLTGILPVFIFGMCMDYIFQLTLLFWPASTDQVALFFVIPCFNALGDAVWQAQTNALYGILFLTSESAAAFSNYKFWESIGRILGFSYSSRLCSRVKLYILIGNLTVGMALYFVIHFVFINRKNQGKLKAKSKKYFNENIKNGDVVVDRDVFADEKN